MHVGVIVGKESARCATRMQNIAPPPPPPSINRTGAVDTRRGVLRDVRRRRRDDDAARRPEQDGAGDQSRVPPKERAADPGRPDWRGSHRRGLRGGTTVSRGVSGGGGGQAGSGWLPCAYGKYCGMSLVEHRLCEQFGLTLFRCGVSQRGRTQGEGPWR